MSSILELAAGLALAAAAVFFVLRPVLSPPAASVPDATIMDGEDPDDDLSPRAVALRALKEIEFDRATGKLSDADYDALNAKYTAEALAALREESPQAAAAPRIRPAVSPLPTATCPAHGARPEAGAIFCSACGRRLSDAVAFCAKCGTALPPVARFCAACGRRVAA